MRVRLGSCVLDTDCRQLTRGDSPVALSPKALRLLEVLVEREPRAVSHEELRALIWPELRVGGTTLARLVNEIRRVLGEPAGAPSFVRTIPRFGYAVGGCIVERSVSVTAGGAIASLEWQNRRIPLALGKNMIGRAPDALVSVASSRVSRHHAQILVSEHRAVLEDLGSKNGTYLGGKRIDRAIELKHGDCIKVGPAVLIFHDAAEQDSTESTSYR
jgi:DNA-binding winged helix-turn-helix (wHTH) protein